MNKLVVPLLFLLLAPLNVQAECWLIGRRDNGAEIYECNSRTAQLPVCGSQYDTGDRCVVRHQSRRVPMRPQVTGPGPHGSATGRTPQGAAGRTPFNAGGSWPSAAERFANGSR